MRVILSTILCALFVGCGSGDPSASRLKDAQSDSVFLVVLGGNSSCKPDESGVRSPLGMDMYEPFHLLDDQMTNGNGWNVSWFITCHNSDAAVKWVSSEAPDQMQSMTIAQVAPKLQDMISANAPGHVFIAGHSYGGWLALKLAGTLAEDVKIEGLFSIDPISRPNCTLANPAQCTQAPTDITAGEYAAVGERTDHFVNFFENQTPFLHSGPIREADENIQVQAGHTGIDTHANVWTKLTTMIARRLF